MTPAEHYALAEEHLETAARAEVGSVLEAYLLASAQVHATLALAQTLGSQ